MAASYTNASLSFRMEHGTVWEDTFHPQSTQESLKRNMPYLWTAYDYPKLGIPNTNNALEGTFTDIKSKLRVHSGIKKVNRSRFLDEYIARHYY